MQVQQTYNTWLSSQQENSEKLNTTKKSKIKPVFALILNFIVVGLFIVGVLYALLYTQWTVMFFAYFSFDISLIIAAACIINIAFIFIYLFGPKLNLAAWYTIRLTLCGMGLLVAFIFNIMFLLHTFLINQTPDYPSFINSYNIFFMTILPLVNAISFIFFEHTAKVHFKHCFWSSIPTTIYLVIYCLNCVYSQNDAGIISFDVDFYLLFVYGGTNTIIFCVGIVCFGYIFTAISWFINKRFKLWR